MNGLLQFLQTPAGQGLLSAGLGVAANAGRGGTWNAIGRGGLMGLQGYANASEQERLKPMRDMEMQLGLLNLNKAKRDASTDQAIGDAARQSYITPEMAFEKNGVNMGPQPDGSALPHVNPGFDTKAYTQKLFGIAPLKGMEFQQAQAKSNAPIKLGAGESLIDPVTLQPRYTAPKETDLPSAVREYQFAKQQGYGGSFEQWQLQQKKAGATNVSVNTEKSFLGDVAGGVGKSIVEAKGGAQAALGTIGTVGRLFDALDSGKVMAGPGTTFRQYGLQLGSMLGVGGKDAKESLLNTRQAIQSLAQLELDAAQQMKGQGQITEAERSIIRRAASGDIDGMTTAELRLLGGVLDRSARTKIRGYNSQIQPLLKNPQASSIAPYLSVEEPGERQQSNVLRFDANGNPVR
jgi:hypothetical protein